MKSEDWCIVVAALCPCLHFFPPPYPPGFEPPQLSLWFCLAMISSETLGLLLAVCLAALQLEREKKPFG